MKRKIGSSGNQQNVRLYRRLPRRTRTNIISDYDVNITYINNKPKGESLV